jgi:WD40 repeat protein
MSPRRFLVALLLLALIWDLETRKLRATLEGHKDRIEVLAFSPDGKLLATGAGEIKLWGAATGKEVRSLPGSWVGSRRASAGYPSPEQVLAFSPDSRFLVSADVAAGPAGEKAKKWDVATGRFLGELPTTDAVAFAFSPDGLVLASAHRDLRVRLWSAEMKEVKQAVLSGVPSGLAFSPDGKMLACGSWPGQVKVVDVALTPEALSPPIGPHRVECVALSPDGKVLATAATNVADPSRPGEVKLWCPRTGEARATFRDFKYPVNAVAFSPDGKVLASGGGLWDRWHNDPGEVKLCDLATGQWRSVAGVVPRAIYSVAFSPDGKVLAAGGREATLWDVSSGKLLGQLAGTKDWVNAVAFSPTGKLLATGSGTNEGKGIGHVQLWDSQTRQERAWLKGHEQAVLSVAFSPDGKKLASGSKDGTARLWDVAGAREEGAVGLGRGTIGFPSPVTGVAFAPSGRVLTTVQANGNLADWNVSNRQSRFGTWLNLQGVAAGHLTTVSYAKQGALRVVGGGTWQAWRYYDLQNEMPFRGGHSSTVASIAFAPDGRSYATCDTRGIVRVWDTATGRRLGLLPLRRSPKLGAYSLLGFPMAYSPDGDVLAVAWETDVQFWDVRRKQYLTTLKGHPRRVGSLAFSPDGRLLASGEQFQFSGKLQESRLVVKLWDVTARKEWASLDGHGPVFFLDGQTLACSVWERGRGTSRASLVDVASRKVKATFEGSHFLAVHGKERLAVTGELADWGRSGATIWDTATGRIRQRPQAIAWGQALFSPDGKSLFLQVVRTNSVGWTIFDVATGQERFTLEMAGDVPALSPDGRVLVEGGRKRGLDGPGVVRALRAATQEEVAARVRADAFTRPRPRAPDERGRRARAAGMSGVLPEEVTDNSNELVLQHRGGLAFATNFGPSDEPPSEAVDGRLERVWQPFWSRKPLPGPPRWFGLTFPVDVSVRRVTVLGGRPWGSGLSALRLEVRDSAGKVLQSRQGERDGDFNDFEFRFPAAVERARALRLLLADDAGASKFPAQIVVGEVLVE